MPMIRDRDRDIKKRQKRPSVEEECFGGDSLQRGDRESAPNPIASKKFCVLGFSNLELAGARWIGSRVLAPVACVSVDRRIGIRRGLGRNVVLLGRPAVAVRVSCRDLVRLRMSLAMRSRSERRRVGPGAVSGRRMRRDRRRLIREGHREGDSACATRARVGAVVECAHSGVVGVGRVQVTVLLLLLGSHLGKSWDDAVGALLGAAGIDRAGRALLLGRLLLLRAVIVMAVALANSALLARRTVLATLDLPLSADKAASSTTLEFGSAGGPGAREIAFEHHAGTEVGCHAVAHGGNSMGSGTRGAIAVTIGATAGGRTAHGSVARRHARHGVCIVAIAGLHARIGAVSHAVVIVALRRRSRDGSVAAVNARRGVGTPWPMTTGRSGHLIISRGHAGFAKLGLRADRTFI